MQRYMNLGGDSGVVAFEVAPGEITVQFRDGWYYLYTSASAGAANIDEMQTLAQTGRGLNSFINQFVRKGYARKWR